TPLPPRHILPSTLLLSPHGSFLFSRRSPCWASCSSRSLGAKLLPFLMLTRVPCCRRLRWSCCQLSLSSSPGRCSRIFFDMDLRRNVRVGESTRLPGLSSRRHLGCDL